MIKIEFPAGRADIALAIGQALTTIGAGEVVEGRPADKKPGITAADGEHYEFNDAHQAKTVAEVTEHEAKTVDEAAVAEVTKHDDKGVAFDRDMCGESEVPFYTSGARKGQWKKRRGVADDTYDQWYADQLLGGKVESAEPDNAAAQAFGAEPEVTEGTPADPVPTNPGELMVWVSTQQNAGLLAAADVAQAYEASGLNVGALFAAAGAEQAAMVATLYGILSAKAAA